ncbi:MAG: hypothetical protein HKN37_12720 [Rhodothermales bacterium]|nr:hypothetical protein [Rhodothermales bacterium]
MAGAFRDSGSWLPAFVISGVLCLVAAGLAMSLKPPASGSAVEAVKA